VSGSPVGARRDRGLAALFLFASVELVADVPAAAGVLEELETCRGRIAPGRKGKGDKGGKAGGKKGKAKEKGADSDQDGDEDEVSSISHTSALQSDMSAAHSSLPEPHAASYFIWLHAAPRD